MLILSLRTLGTATSVRYDLGHQSNLRQDKSLPDLLGKTPFLVNILMIRKGG